MEQTIDIDRLEEGFSDPTIIRIMTELKNKILAMTNENSRAPHVVIHLAKQAKEKYKMVEVRKDTDAIVPEHTGEDYGMENTYLTLQGGVLYRIINRDQDWECYPIPDESLLAK